MRGWLPRVGTTHASRRVVSAGKRLNEQPQHKPACCAGSDNSPGDSLGVSSAAGRSTHARICRSHHAVFAPAQALVWSVWTMGVPVAVSAVSDLVVLGCIPVTTTMMITVHTRRATQARATSDGVHGWPSCDNGHQTRRWFRSEMTRTGVHQLSKTVRPARRRSRQRANVAPEHADDGMRRTRGIKGRRACFRFQFDHGLQ